MKQQAFPKLVVAFIKEVMQRVFGVKNFDVDFSCIHAGKIYSVCNMFCADGFKVLLYKCS